MDPFSISIAAVGITGTAINGISKLQETISRIKNAQESMDDIRSQLDNIRRPLDTLQTLVLDEDECMAARQTLARMGLGTAVNDCGKACEAFDKRLKKWTKHSNDDTLTLQDKWSIGVWNRERMHTLKTRIETCQRTVHFAISSTQLITQEKSAQRSNAEHERLCQQIQNFEHRTQDTLVLLQKQQEEAAQRQDLLLQARDDDDDDDDDGDDAGDEGQRTLALQELSAQSRIRGETRASLETVFAQLRACRTRQVIGDVATDQESRALVGLPESSVGKIDQRIGDVSTRNKSSSMVGVFDHGVDMKDFLKR